MLPGFIKVFSCVGHSTGGSQPLTQRSCGHVHKLLLLFACTYKTCILHFGIFRTMMQPRQQLQSAEPRMDDLHANCYSAQVQTEGKLYASKNLTDGCSHGNRNFCSVSVKVTKGETAVSKLREQTALKRKIVSAESGRTGTGCPSRMESTLRRLRSSLSLR